MNLAPCAYPLSNGRGVCKRAKAPAADVCSKHLTISQTDYGPEIEGRCNAPKKPSNWADPSVPERCKAPAMENGRCRTHGGKSTPAGVDHHRFEHGHRSKIRTRIRQATAIAAVEDKGRSLAQVIMRLQRQLELLRKNEVESPLDMATHDLRTEMQLVELLRKCTETQARRDKINEKMYLSPAEFYVLVVAIRRTFALTARWLKGKHGFSDDALLPIAAFFIDEIGALVNYPESRDVYLAARCAELGIKLDEDDGRPILGEDVAFTFHEARLLGGGDDAEAT